jgi:hypothetical protein
MRTKVAVTRLPVSVSVVSRSVLDRESESLNRICLNR